MDTPVVALAAGGGHSPLVGDLGLCLVAAAILANLLPHVEILRSEEEHGALDGHREVID